MFGADTVNQGTIHRLAQRFGEDTTVVVGPRVPGADLRIRYFAPDHDVCSSGHATKAEVAALVTEALRQLRPARVETLASLCHRREQPFGRWLPCDAGAKYAVIWDRAGSRQSSTDSVNFTTKTGCGRRTDSSRIRRAA